jgi:hypothetical protein
MRFFQYPPSAAITVPPGLAQETTLQSILDLGSFVPLNKSLLDFAITNVDDTAYIQILASIGAVKVRKIQIFMSSGEPLYLAFGAAASEVDKIYIIPGGNGLIDIEIPIATRLSVKAVNAATTVNSGILMINYLG